MTLNPPTAVTDRETWDRALNQLPAPQTLQSWDWGDFKSRWGWQPTRLLWADGTGRPLAAAQILRRPIPKTPWAMFYLPRGPILDFSDLVLVSQVLRALADFGRSRRGLFIKIDPFIPIAAEPDDPLPLPGGQACRALLAELGWHYAPQQIQFKNTVLLDIGLDEEALLAAMKAKWRYNIRLAGRKGAVIKTGGPADLADFYQLYAQTAERDRFLIRPAAYYLDVWEQYLQAGRAELLLATVEQTPVAGLILFYYGQTAWYMYGASSGQHRQAMPNHLLQWAAIRAAKSRGCTGYDLWGAPDVFEQTDSMWGVYRFKMGFGGQTVQTLGAYDLPLQPLPYRLYNTLLPRLLSVTRKLAAR